MDSNSHILQEKALQLVARERELNTLRNKHLRLLNWLTLAQSLPELVDRSLTLAQIGARFLSQIISLIKLQRVYLLEIAPDGLRPFGTEGPIRPPLTSEALARISSQRSGMVNDPSSTPEQALAESLNLYRLLWYRIDACPGKVVLLIGGFDEQRASSYMPFDQEDAEHFAHAGQHFESLLSNVFLLNALELEKLRLERFNEELEQRVQERTKELAQANHEMNLAFSALREKDRRLSDDLAQARAFQQSILPTLPESPALEFGAMYLALDMVGGDIYDVAQVAPDHFRVFMADATGHGVQASLRTIVIKSEYDRIKHSHRSPESALLELNRRLVETYSETEMLCTACCFDITLEAKGARLLYSIAAHPPLLLHSEDGTRELYQAGAFLGLSSDIRLRVEEEHLKPGDLVIAYTDGISDQVGVEGEPFELHRAIEQNFRQPRRLSEALNLLGNTFDQFCGPIPRADDITVVTARIG